MQSSLYYLNFQLLQKFFDEMDHKMFEEIIKLDISSIISLFTKIEPIKLVLLLYLLVVYFKYFFDNDQISLILINKLILIKSKNL